MQRRSFLGLLAFVPFIGKVSWFKNAEFEREVAWVWSKVECVNYGGVHNLITGMLGWQARSGVPRPSLVPEKFGNAFGLYQAFTGLDEFEEARQQMDRNIRTTVKAFKPVDPVDWVRSNSFRSNVPNTLNKNRLAV